MNEAFECYSKSTKKRGGKLAITLLLGWALPAQVKHCAQFSILQGDVCFARQRALQADNIRSFTKTGCEYLTQTETRRGS